MPRDFKHLPELDAYARNVVARSIGESLHPHFPTEPLPQKLQALVNLLAEQDIPNHLTR